MNESEIQTLLSEHPEMAKYIQYIPPSYRQRGYYRIKPYTDFNPAKNQLIYRLLLAKTAYNSYGMKGLAEVNGQLMPVAAAQVKKAMKGKKLPPKPSDALKRLQKLLERIGKTVEARTIV